MLRLTRKKFSGDGVDGWSVGSNQFLFLKKSINPLNINLLFLDLKKNKLLFFAHIKK
jgi:hypothetical protein